MIYFATTPQPVTELKKAEKCKEPVLAKAPIANGIDFIGIDFRLIRTRFTL